MRTFYGIEPTSKIYSERHAFFKVLRAAGWKDKNLMGFKTRLEADSKAIEAAAITGAQVVVYEHGYAF